MKLKFLLFIALCFSTYSISFGQKSESEITDKFFALFEKDPIGAIDYAFSTNKWMRNNQDATTNLKNQFKNTLALIGDYQGYELITEKTIGDSYKLKSYMVKYDRQPLRLTFMLYKPKDIWQVQNFKYDDGLKDELEEAAKIYFLREDWKF